MGDPIGSFLLERGRGTVTTMNPARRQATYEDLLKVPDILIAEIIDGELITSPRPAIPYSHASGAILGELSPFDRGFGEARSRGTLVGNYFWPDRSSPCPHYFSGVYPEEDQLRLDFPGQRC